MSGESALSHRLEDALSLLLFVLPKPPFLSWPFKGVTGRKCLSPPYCFPPNAVIYHAKLVNAHVGSAWHSCCLLHVP